MPTINNSRILNNPKWSQSFIVMRQTGIWQNARFVNDGNPKNIPFTGVIIPQDKEMDQVAEGDMIKELIDVYTKCAIHTTEITSRFQGTLFSDQITWECRQYKVLSVRNFGQYGHYHSLATRILGT